MIRFPVFLLPTFLFNLIWLQSISTVEFQPFCPTLSSYMRLHFRYVHFLICIFFWLLSLISQTGRVTFISECFLLQSTLILVLTEEESPKIFLVEFLFHFSYFRELWASSAVHSFGSGGTAWLRVWRKSGRRSSASLSSQKHVRSSYVCFNLNKHKLVMSLNCSQL